LGWATPALLTQGRAGLKREAMNELIVFAKRLLDAALLPPGGLLLLIVVSALWLLRAKTLWRRRGAAALLICAVAGLYLSCTRAGVWWLAHSVEKGLVAQTPASLGALMQSPKPPQALVILGSGTRLDERETPTTFALHPRTLQRVQHGAWIHGLTGLPILVSGGSSREGWPAEGQTMAEVLKRDFGREVRWIEAQSLDTRDNATMSARMLRDAGIERIVLVTHAAHMPRSLEVFRATGLEVEPAPHGFSGAAGGSWGTAWWPSADALGQVWLISHELLGAIWYRLSASR
jgi:uncharacterized SAM-binding protein YcdF (DUF218 family)